MHRVRIAALLAVTTLAACGGDDGGASDEDAAEQTVRDAIAAGDAGDGEKKCDLNTDEYNQSVYGGRDECIKEAEPVPEDLRGGHEIEDVKVDGDRATVRVVLDDISERTWTLRREDGRFKVAAISSAKIRE